MVAQFFKKLPHQLVTYLKSDIFQNSPQSNQIYGPPVQENLQLVTLKMAQSGHTSHKFIHNGNTRNSFLNTQRRLRNKDLIQWMTAQFTTSSMLDDVLKTQLPPSKIDLIVQPTMTFYSNSTNMLKIYNFSNSCHDFTYALMMVLLLAIKRKISLLQWDIRRPLFHAKHWIYNRKWANLTLKTRPRRCNHHSRQLLPFLVIRLLPLFIVLRTE